MKLTRLAALLIVVGFASRTFAQTGVDLLVKPWDEGQRFDSDTQAVIEPSVPSQENHADDIQLSSYHAEGRLRLFPDKQATPTLGYDVSYFDINSHDTALPKHLWDTEVGVAQPVAEFQKWFVVLTAGVGYAGDSPYSDPHATFFSGNVIVGRKYSEDRAVIVALNYNGNRTFLPDCPIPGVAFADRYNEHVTYVIGIPVDSITYEPVKGFQFDLGYEYLETFSMRAGWEFMKHYSLYSTYTDRFSAFHLSNLPEDRRLFLQEHRAELGFRYNPTREIRFSIGGGWAFGQEFSTGYDSRGTNPLRHLRDTPFVEGLMEIGF